MKNFLFILALIFMVGLTPQLSQAQPQGGIDYLSLTSSALRNYQARATQMGFDVKDSLQLKFEDHVILVQLTPNNSLGIGLTINEDVRLSSRRGQVSIRSLCPTTLERMWFFDPANSLKLPSDSALAMLTSISGDSSSTDTVQHYAPITRALLDSLLKKSMNSVNTGRGCDTVVTSLGDNFFICFISDSLTGKYGLRGRSAMSFDKRRYAVTTFVAPEPDIFRKSDGELMDDPRVSEYIFINRTGGPALRDSLGNKIIFRREFQVPELVYTIKTETKSNAVSVKGSSIKKKAAKSSSQNGQPAQQPPANGNGSSGVQQPPVTGGDQTPQLLKAGEDPPATNVVGTETHDDGPR